MSEWKTFTIEQLAAPTKSALATGPFGSAISSKFFRDSGIPVIRGSNLSLDVGHRLIEDDIVFVDEVKAVEFERSVAVRGDLIFTCWGTIGQVGLIDSRSKYEKYVVSNKQMKLTVERSLVDSVFLYYLLSSPGSMAQVRNMSIGSSVPGFNLSQLRGIRVSIPDLARQRAISGVLAALDDKIAINEQLAKASTDLAYAYFLSIQKIPGNATGLSAHIDLVYGKALREPDRRPGVIPVFGCTGQVGWHDSSLTTEPTIIVGRKGANAGHVSWADGSCWVIDTAFYVHLRDGSYLTPEFTYFLLQDAGLKDLVGDSAVPGLNRGTALSRYVSIPEQDQVHRFSGLVRPLVETVSSMNRQNRKLMALRDLLLPKLMSGEIRVRDAEKVVEEVV